MSKQTYVKAAAILAGERAIHTLPVGVRGVDSDHYRLVAHANNDAVAQTVDHIAGGLADMFATDNPRFDRARFMTACGVAS